MHNKGRTLARQLKKRMNVVLKESVTNGRLTSLGVFLVFERFEPTLLVLYKTAVNYCHSKFTRCLK